MTVTVIISTYNHPKWLEKVLWGYECQSYENFNIIIADDGSGDETSSIKHSNKHRANILSSQMGTVFLEKIL